MIPGFGAFGVRPQVSDKTHMTTLANGIRIVSETGPETGNNNRAAVGLFIDCGSIYETPTSSGVSNLLEGMGFWTTNNRSQRRITEEMKAIGVNRRTAKADQEHIVYTIDGYKAKFPLMVQLLVDCVMNPAFLDCEVKERLQDLKFLISVFAKKPRRLIMEALHSTGFSGALTNPTLAPESAVSRLNSQILKDFVSENFTAPRIVLSAYGVDHGELVSIAKPLLFDLPAVPRPEEPKSVYVGGDYRCQAEDPSGITHFALAFEAPGGRTKQKDCITMTLLNLLMGGGPSKSPGSSGNENSKRLCLRVLKKYPQIHHFASLLTIHYETGLFGIIATTSSDFASEAIDIAVKELIVVATPGNVKQEELDAARAEQKSGVLKNMKYNWAECEVIGREILIFGERRPVKKVLESLDKVTLEDIAELAEKMLSTPLTMACYGDILNVPSYEEVSSKFKSTSENECAGSNK